MNMPEISWPAASKHLTFLTIGDNIYYYSYSTLIAFCVGCQLVIRENNWGITTSKHLNFIHPDHKIRVSTTRFEELFKELHA